MFSKWLFRSLRKSRSANQEKTKNKQDWLAEKMEIICLCVFIRWFIFCGIKFVVIVQHRNSQFFGSLTKKKKKKKIKKPNQIPIVPTG